MYNTKVIKTALVLLFVICATSAFAATLTDEIKWMDGVSGLNYGVGTEHGTSATRTYTVSGDESSIVNSLKAGLTKRGWIVKVHTIDTAGVKVITFKASKDAMKLEGVLRGGIGMNTMEVSIRGKASPSKTTAGTPKTATKTDTATTTKTTTSSTPATTTKTTTDSTTTTPVVKTTTTTKTTTSSSTKNVDVALDDPNAKEAGSDMSINDSNIKVTYKCSNSDFTINGSGNTITLLGTVKSISINGSNNKITIKGKIVSISALGSSNTIYWSQKYNPVKPAYSSLGYGNVIKSIP